MQEKKRNPGTLLGSGMRNIYMDQITQMPPR